ncbi:MAG: hypothetical protein ACP5M0_09110 [Desulfomonilaceae bacterium]
MKKKAITALLTALVGALLVAAFTDLVSFQIGQVSDVQGHFLSSTAPPEASWGSTAQFSSRQIYQLCAVDNDDAESQADGDDSGEKDETSADEDLGIDRTWSVVQFAKTFTPRSLRQFST